MIEFIVAAAALGGVAYWWHRSKKTEPTDVFNYTVDLKPTQPQVVENQGSAAAETSDPAQVVTTSPSTQVETTQAEPEPVSAVTQPTEEQPAKKVKKPRAKKDPNSPPKEKKARTRRKAPASE